MFQKVKADFPGMKIAYPAIGSGLSGGDWATNKSIIDRELQGTDHTFVAYAVPS